VPEGAAEVDVIAFEGEDDVAVALAIVFWGVEVSVPACSLFPPQPLSRAVARTRDVAVAYRRMIFLALCSRRICVVEPLPY